MTSEIVLFENYRVRRKWDDKQEKWYFSVTDIVGILSVSSDPRKYWNKLAERLREEGSEVVTKCHRLKMKAADGKMRLIDAADSETMLRIIQSVPSPKAEPLKLWLARVGYERLQDISDPERSLNRARDYWQRMGRPKEWIQQRMMGQEIRNKLTDYWKGHEIEKQDEYAILTNIIHKEWSDLSVKEHKSLKKLKTENLRDHMSDAELIFTALAELSTRQIAEKMRASGFVENKTPAKKGGRIAKRARLDLEAKTGKRVVTGSNFKLNSRKQKILK